MGLPLFYVPEQSIFKGVADLPCVYSTWSFVFFCGPILNAQARTDSLLAALILDGKSELVREIAGKKDEFRLQVIYTEINRDALNRPSFRNYCFNVDTNTYFNSAFHGKIAPCPARPGKIERSKALWGK
jgi:hypothetical protein